MSRRDSAESTSAIWWALATHLAGWAQNAPGDSLAVRLRPLDVYEAIHALEAAGNGPPKALTTSSTCPAAVARQLAVGVVGACDRFFYFGVGAELEGGLTAGPLLLPGNPGT
jgi:hypothetical protein